MDGMPSSANGRMSSALTEYRRLVKSGARPLAEAVHRALSREQQALAERMDFASPTRAIQPQPRKTLTELREDLCVRIMLANRTGEGISLSAEDVESLANEPAINAAADALLNRNGFMLTKDGIKPIP